MRFSLPIKPGQAFDFSGEEADGTLGTVKHVLSESYMMQLLGFIEKVLHTLVTKRQQQF